MEGILWELKGKVLKPVWSCAYGLVRLALTETGEATGRREQLGSENMKSKTRKQKEVGESREEIGMKKHLEDEGGGEQTAMDRTHTENEWGE